MPATEKIKKQQKTSSITWNAVPAYLFNHLRPRPEQEGIGVAPDREVKARSLFYDEAAATESCKTAASPLAYLSDLMEYVQNHLWADNTHIGPEALETRFHQPFGALQRDCHTQSREVRQIQLCIEVLRAYLGPRPLADAEQEDALAEAEAAYREAAYRSLLLYLGTSYEEMEQAAAADEATRMELARRLGIDVSALDNFWVEAANLSEDWLEQHFGLPGTTGAPLSEGVKEHDTDNQLRRWFFSGLKWNETTDENGKIYLSLRWDTNKHILEVYQDAARTNLLASGSNAEAIGTFELAAVDQSGLSGSVDIKYIADTNELAISIFPAFLACRLQKVRERWQEQEDSEGEAGRQFLEEQEQSARSSLQEAVRKTAAAHLSALRSGLMEATGLNARRLSEQLMIGCEYDASFQTTRVWQAITSLQQLILSVRSGLVLDTHPDLTLNAPDFEEEWQWLGSYESWRSAMMVFLYPENMLSPGLRKEQTPVFRQVAEELRKKRYLNAKEANLIANTYHKYFKDVCELEVQATCRTVDKDFYQFATVRQGVYWATYNKSNETAWKQSPWKKISGFEGYSVYQILGAVPYRNSEEKHHIYLFGLANLTQPFRQDAKGDHFLLVSRMNLETQEWDEEPKVFDSFQLVPEIVVEQSLEDFRPPRLVYHYGGNNGLQMWQLNGEGTHWKEGAPQSIETFDHNIRSVHALAVVGGKTRLFHKSDNINNRVATVIRNPEPGATNFITKQYTTTDTGDFIGLVIDTPETAWQFANTGIGPVCRLITITNQDDIQVNAQKPAPVDLSGMAIHCGIQEERLPGPGPIPSPELNYGFRIAYFGSGEQAGQYHAIFERTEEDGLELHSPSQIVPKDVNFYSLKPDKNVTTQARKQIIEAAFSNNQHAPAYTLNYLWEVWYFLPMVIAAQLQRSRQYRAGQDWFRLVYNYSLPIAERKIFYGLKQEEDYEANYNQPANWRADPLNPHAIAVGRANAYSRYTLYSLIQGFLQEADGAFTRDTGESLASARMMYETALELLDAPELQQEAIQIDDQWDLPANPLTALLRFHAEINLFKIHTSRNIAGDVREIPVITTEPDFSFDYLGNGYGGTAVLSPDVNLRPTPFRYAVLMDRAKYLTSMAQQMEASFLSALEKLDAERLNLLNAKNDLEISKAGIRLQDLRVKEAKNGVQLAEYQSGKSRYNRQHFETLISEGYLQSELSALKAIKPSGLRTFIKGSLGLAIATASASSGGIALSALAAANSLFSTYDQMRQESSNYNLHFASFERRTQEWKHQLNLADHDILISDQQVQIAQDQVQIVNQERQIADIRYEHAREVADFLLTKFTSAELYEWMSDVLEGIYSFFLQQATATAQLAAQQLAFERQEPVPAVILSDYWEAPQNGQAAALDADGAETTRRGLTGSARLLKDLNQLDQIAFQTDRRKLQMSKTISLAQLSPAEFQRFRETGRLPFHTPMELFARDFPGQYLRLIKRVRVSVIALTPPTEGIKATLSNHGISRVTLSNGFTFETTEVRRPPESIAFTSPLNATGLFELQADDGKLLPFESMGVDTFWELQLPKAANFFDYSSIADVLLTIEYTALNSLDYRRQVIERLDPDLSADRAFSFRQEFPDQWYDFHHPELTDTPMTVTFDTRRVDFPANLEGLRIRHVVLYFSRKEEGSSEVEVRHLKFKQQDNDQALGSNDQNLSTVEGVLSSRSGNIPDWDPFIAGDKTPVGTWELALPDTEEILDRFKTEEIEDILFVITFEGTTLDWPA